MFIILALCFFALLSYFQYVKDRATFLVVGVIFPWLFSGVTVLFVSGSEFWVAGSEFSVWGFGLQTHDRASLLITVNCLLFTDHC